MLSICYKNLFHGIFLYNNPSILREHHEQSMNNELEIIAQKYTEIALNSASIESHYYRDALTKSSYQKISKGPLLNIRIFEEQLAGSKLGKELKKSPKAIKNTHVYYCDQADNVLMVEIYGQVKTIIYRPIKIITFAN